MPLFAVIRARGAAWRTDRTPDQQDAFLPHAAHMNQLFDSGAVVLGGWLGDAGDVLLVMRAATAADASRLLDADPWTALDILPVVRLEPWSLGLGALPNS